MDQQNTIKFLIADDHSLIRQGLIFLIEEVFPNFEVIQISMRF